MKTKICTKCGEEKLLSEYYKEKNGKNGLRASCKVCERQRTHQYRQENIEWYKEYSKKYRQENKESREEYRQDKYNTDHQYRLKTNIRNIIYKALLRGGYTKNTKTEKILGCSYDEFVKHIESQFVEGMSWENQGEWHLDHIIPVSSYEDEDELIKLNHYTNLQPLWAEDNMKKSDSYLEEDKQRFLEQFSLTLKIKQ